MRARRPDSARVGAPVMAVSSNAGVGIGISPDLLIFYWRYQNGCNYQQQYQFAECSA
jgi:hypothetical protein